MIKEPQHLVRRVIVEADTRRRRLAVLGIGNPLVGDDGVGPAVVEALRNRWHHHDDLLLDVLDGDLIAVADLLPKARNFIFVDAIAGDPPGAIVLHGQTTRAFAPSLHQTDIGAVMDSLQWLEVVHPFPEWQLWGVTVRPPTELGIGLSEPVSVAVDQLIGALDRQIDELLGD